MLLVRTYNARKNRAGVLAVIPQLVLFSHVARTMLRLKLTFCEHVNPWLKTCIHHTGSV